MYKFMMMSVAALLMACGAEAEVGDACETDDDCAEGLVCHFDEPSPEDMVDEPGECMEEGDHSGHDMSTGSGTSTTTTEM
jgi:hypothetical protein